MSKLYFTLLGADRIMRKKQHFVDELKLTQGKKAEAAEVGGNQWHDNFSFEQLMRDEAMLNRQIAEVNLTISKMIVIDGPPSKDISKLRIGHIAELNLEDEIKTYLVGGFEDFDASTNPHTISYLAPLICQFIGKECGYTANVKIAGKLKKVTLKNISIPRKEV